jgi:hypothetical protein
LDTYLVNQYIWQGGYKNEFTWGLYIKGEKLECLKGSLSEIYYEMSFNNLPVKLNCGALMVGFNASDYGLN